MEDNLRFSAKAVNESKFRREFLNIPGPYLLESRLVSLCLRSVRTLLECLNIYDSAPTRSVTS